MLKKDITYETFDGETVTDTFYFNLTEAELIELQLGAEESMEDRLRRIIKTQNNAELFSQFKEIILMSVGEKSEDGRRFTKNDEIRQSFAESAAYNELFVELFTDVDKLTAFIQGTFPKKFANEVEKIDTEQVLAQIMNEETPKDDTTPVLPPPTSS